MIKRIIFTSLKIMGVATVVGGLLYWRLWAPVTVESHVVERGALASEVMGTGTLEARTQTMISPKIAGRILELTVDEGDKVTAGQKLVRLDDAELQQQVAIAAANVEVAESNIDRLESDQTRAEAVVTQATSSHERKVSLASQSAISREELDQSLEALTVAQAGLGASESAIVQGKKSLLAAQELLTYHKARLSDTIIMAPFDGLVIKRRREVGDIVVPGTNILTLISIDSLWISAWVDETEIAKLRIEQPSRIVFRSEPERSFLGKVVRIGQEADRETREVIVDVELLERPEYWAIGQRAEVYIENGRSADALTVPLKFCELEGNKATIFIEQSGVAKVQTVDVTLRARDRIAVSNGVNAGDILLRSPDGAKLRDGQKVRLP
jgi:HlyD family secretion protein